MYRRSHSLSSVLHLCNFGSNGSLESFWTWCHTYLWAVLRIPPCSTSQGPSGWMGSVSAQSFSYLSRDVQLDLSLGSGWATQGHSQSCPEATPLLSVCFGSWWRVSSRPQFEVLTTLEKVFI